MSITKTVFFFLFSVSLAPFLVFRGQNLSAVNYQNLGKTLKKNKGCFMQTLHYKNYIMGIKLWELYYGYCDWMAFIIGILLEEINATCQPIFFKFIRSKITMLLTKLQ